jgi:cytochrome P450
VPEVLNPEAERTLIIDTMGTSARYLVEELLRYLTILNEPNFRVAAEDLEIGGQVIKAGKAVIPLTFSANRDDGHYADADVLDIRRGARDHLAFGYGIHQCLGQPLPRAELQIVMPELFRRLPNLRVTVPLEEIAFKQGTSVYGVHSLPVSW